jgi:hypothetical protein
MFDKFSIGNFYLREQGTGNREHTETIKSSSLPLQGQDKVDKVDKVTREKNSTKSVFLVRKIAH